MWQRTGIESGPGNILGRNAGRLYSSNFGYNHGVISCFYHACCSPLINIVVINVSQAVNSVHTSYFDESGKRSKCCISALFWFVLAFGQIHVWKVLINLCRQVIMIKHIFRENLFQHELKLLNFWSLEPLHMNSCLVLSTFLWTVCWTWNYCMEFSSIFRLFTFKRFPDKQGLVCFKFDFLLQNSNVIYLRKLKAS